MGWSSDDVRFQQPASNIMHCPPARTKRIIIWEGTGAYVAPFQLLYRVRGQARRHGNLLRRAHGSPELKKIFSSLIDTDCLLDRHQRLPPPQLHKEQNTVGKYGRTKKSPLENGLKSFHNSLCLEKLLEYIPNCKIVIPAWPGSEEGPAKVHSANMAAPLSYKG